jgi:hypothetical protein
MQAPQFPQTPALTPQSLSHLCARYLQMRFRIELDARSPTQIDVSLSLPASQPAQPLMLPVALASELDRIASTLADAFLNRG